MEDQGEACAMQGLTLKPTLLEVESTYNKL